MAQNFDLASLLAGIQQPVKRSAFLSYHHGGDQAYYNAFTQAFDDTYDILFNERKLCEGGQGYPGSRSRCDLFGLPRMRDACKPRAGASCHGRSTNAKHMTARRGGSGQRRIRCRDSAAAS